MNTRASAVATFPDLQSFALALERRNLLRRISEPVSLVHEMADIHRRSIEENGPALLFETPIDASGRTKDIPVLVNLFGTRERIELGFGLQAGGLANLGDMLGELHRPTPPKSIREAWDKLPLVQRAMSMRPKRRARSPAQVMIRTAEEVDLSLLPIQWCWPCEPAPLVTWPMVITCCPDDPSDINVGIYRMQVRDQRSLIMRWLDHRGGAKHHRAWQRKGLDMPVTIAIGADPVSILSAVMPLPEGVSEINFAGLLRSARTEVTPALTVPMPIPTNAEIILEGTVSATARAPEGPYGDHTGYYNSVEPFPVMTVSAMTSRRKPFYLSTFTGRPPDEPSRLGEVMADLFVPIVKRQFPEICDLWLPSEACSYRAIVVSIDKRYPGQAKRIMMGLWSMLPQFNYTKLIIVVDPDINVRNWAAVIWALSTRFDAGRDLTVIENTPIDYLDFASPRPGLGTKMGCDATNKIGSETERDWGRVLSMPPDVSARADAIWERAKRDL
ncbi:UbiD family decarboxylase [Rhizobium sp. SEMIA 4085]|nr:MULTISPECIES: UbiD family decarboxylase [Rhizobium]NNH29164.1 UbiD family decarboxylase [Rhizobium sp. SEMIA 4085]